MKASTAILLAGSVLLLALLVAQFRWTDAPPDVFARMRTRSIVWALVLFGVFGTLHVLAVEAERPPDPPCCLTTFSTPEEPGTPPPPPPPPTTTTTPPGR